MITLHRILRYFSSAMHTCPGVHNRQPQSQGYIDAKSTLESARALKLSVRDYVEQLWGQQGRTQLIIDRMREVGCFRALRHVCEVGPGTGRYLELTLKEAAGIQRYDIYETAVDWANWLEETYSPVVVRCNADGRSLDATDDASCQLVHAHGVFVYLPILHCFEYFKEMVRVTATEGWLAFDYYPAEEWTVDVIERWLMQADRYPVVLPAQHVKSFFRQFGFELAAEFDTLHGHGVSRYSVFKRSH